MSRLITKPTKWHVRPATTQISLGIRVFAVRMKKAWVLSYPQGAQRRLIRLGGCPGWSESSLDAYVILLVLSWGGSNVFFMCQRRLSFHGSVANPLFAYPDWVQAPLLGLWASFSGYRVKERNFVDAFLGSITSAKSLKGFCVCKDFQYISTFGLIIITQTSLALAESFKIRPLLALYLLRVSGLRGFDFVTRSRAHGWSAFLDPQREQKIEFVSGMLCRGSAHNVSVISGKAGPSHNFPVVKKFSKMWPSRF